MPFNRKKDASRQRKKRTQETAAVAEQKARDAARKRVKRQQDTPEIRFNERTSNNEAHRLRRSNLNPEKLRAFLEAEKKKRRLLQERRTRDVQHETVNFQEETVEEHYCGAMTAICKFCGSKNFSSERPPDGLFNSCCRKGKVRLRKPLDETGKELQYPDFLRELLTTQIHPHHQNFMENIRSYNSAVSFASMGAKVVDVHGRGPYVFKIHGQTYHRTSHIDPVNGENRQYAQLYVVDSTQATETRQQHSANQGCLNSILYQIDKFFRNHNRIAQCYQMMREVMAGQPEPACVNMVMRRDRQTDIRRYNAPTANEVAMVFVDEEGEPPFNRDIRIYPKNPLNREQSFINLNILSPNMDPMTYPLLFPFGEPGWEPNWTSEAYEGATKNRVRTKVSMLQYKVALTAITNHFNPFINSGKLTQQWLVDSYLQVEANNLNFIKHHQKQLRVEQYQGLVDHAALDVNVPAGVKIILPSSFEGSPRNMRERCNDAMSIFSKWGAPDLFITFTANPSWSEITENLNPGQQASDRPDLVARVFKNKLNSLLADITKNHVLGHCIAFVYSIEFQKRGLPHAHILITLDERDKFTTSEKIDQLVSAEIPDPIVNPRLYEIVTKCMVHGPCGSNNPRAPCMSDSKCTKQFPKSFRNETVPNADGYPLYRRREKRPIEIRGKQIDNRYVVPYNPYLSLKFNAHINVEISTSLRAVKYIYKYIFKGFDCAQLNFSSDSTQNNDEVKNYIDCRYVSAPEAMWRLLEYKMHNRSHTVQRLPVHLPNKQQIVFEQGNEDEALIAAATGKTKLESWFNLNVEDVRAHEFLYTEIPWHYVYTKGKWQSRKRGGGKIIARMYTVSFKDEERFFLRLMLLHVRGAVSFESLRTFDGVVYDTFKECAIARGLLAVDIEWERCMTEAGTYQMPKQLRQTFAFICSFCQPSSPITLWNNHLENLIMDYRRHKPEEAAINLALHDINSTLKQHGLSCEHIGLPAPLGIPPIESSFDVQHEAEEGAQRLTSLNSKQQDAFNQIMLAVNDTDQPNRIFYLDGPGGSGKTYLYNTLMAVLRGQEKIVLPFATTGIAATLLKGGRTVHSGFKLPVPLLETSVSAMRLASPEAKMLDQASLIIIDEVTMLTKHGLRCIDVLLREISGIDKPFGNKTMVVGGDFRQTLPVVPRGSRTEIVEASIKSSSLWRNFKTLELSTNMRSEGKSKYNDWLLEIGCGNVPSTTELGENLIEIPKPMVNRGKKDLCDVVFGEKFNELSNEELSKKIIVAPTNVKTLEMNDKIIAKIPGEFKIYFSADTIITEDPTDNLNYPIEFLNRQTPSGMPPHKLILKVGTIVMLIRNLNPKRGLCNGTRLIIVKLGVNSVTAKILSECNYEEEVVIPRIDLAPSDSTLPFILKRRQLPILPAFAITINKSQGQTYEQVGIDLTTNVFSHGQLYVALSRGRDPKKIIVKTDRNVMDKFHTKNVVFKEIFTM